MSKQSDIEYYREKIKYRRDPTPEERYQDIPLRAKPDGYPYRTDYVCPVCDGHGKWIITLNAYGLGNHFYGGCFQCNGYGWVTKEDFDCIHAFREMGSKDIDAYNLAHPDHTLTHFGNCYHITQCTQCGRIRAYDSSG